jgi:hypothetical protein
MDEAPPEVPTSPRLGVVVPQPSAYWLLDTLLFPDHAERPGRRYLDWHRDKVFVA